MEERNHGNKIDSRVTAPYNPYHVYSWESHRYPGLIYSYRRPEYERLKPRDAFLALIQQGNLDDARIAVQAFPSLRPIAAAVALQQFWKETYGIDQPRRRENSLDE